MTSVLFYEPFTVSRLSLFRAETASRRWVNLVTDITRRNESSDVTLAIMRRSSIGITFFLSWNKIKRPFTEMITQVASMQSCIFIQLIYFILKTCQQNSYRRNLHGRKRREVIEETSIIKLRLVTTDGCFFSFKQFGSYKFNRSRFQKLQVTQHGSQQFIC